MNARRFALMIAAALLCLSVVAVTSRQPAAVAAAMPAPANAAATTFDFKDPKGVNAVGFFVDSELEPIMGFASGLSGTIDYDPADPKSFRGSLEIDAGKINTSNPRMTAVMQGADWLDLGNHLKVVFAFDEVVSATSQGDGSSALEVKGRLSIRGIEKPMTVTINANHVADGAARRGAAKSGDLLVLRSTFSIDRTMFNIKPDGGFDKVGREIKLMVAIAGYGG